MQVVTAFAISSFDDIWFAGLSYEPEAPGSRIIAHFNGDEWVICEDPSENGFQKLHFFAPNNGWAYEDNKIYRFNGATWYFAGVVPGVDWLRGCDFKSPTDIWAAGTKKGQGGVVLHYEGGVWREVFSAGPNLYISDVAMWDEYNGWAVGYLSGGYGRIWQCCDGGWVPRICPTERSVYDVEVVSSREAWAVGGSTIIHYETEVNITPASIGRIKALYAAGRGLDSKGATTNASRVPPAPPLTPASRARRCADSNSTEKPADAAD
jgi:hypothetical protein